MFIRINGYPHYIVNSILRKVKEDQNADDASSSEDDTLSNDEDSKQTLMLKLPFRGKKGDTLIRSLKKDLKRNLPDTECRIVHTGSKLSQYFSLKDKVDDKHLSNFIYKFDCRNKKCDDGYVGETGRRKEIRENDHAGKDKESHILHHTNTTKHPRAKEKDFIILGKNYGNKRKRRLAEAMFIRDLKPTLNKQKDSYKLVLFG